MLPEIHDQEWRLLIWGQKTDQIIEATISRQSVALSSAEGSVEIRFVICLTGPSSIGIPNIKKDILPTITFFRSRPPSSEKVFDNYTIGSKISFNFLTNKAFT